LGPLASKIPGGPVSFLKFRPSFGVIATINRRRGQDTSPTWIERQGRKARNVSLNCSSFHVVKIIRKRMSAAVLSFAKSQKRDQIVPVTKQRARVNCRLA